MAGTVTFTTKDRRSDTLGRFPVWEVICTFVLTDTSGADEIKAAVPINGILQQIVAKSGTAAGIGGTFTLAIDDDGNNEIFTASGPAEEGTTVWDVYEPLVRIIDVGVNPNNDPGSGTWTIIITLRGI